MQVTQQVQDESEAVLTPPPPASAPSPDPVDNTPEQISEPEVSLDQEVISDSQIADSLAVAVAEAAEQGQQQECVGNNVSSSPFAKQPVKITSKLNLDAPEWTPNPNATAFQMSAQSTPLPNAHSTPQHPPISEEQARKMLLSMQAHPQPKNDIVNQSEIDQLNSVMASLSSNQNMGQNINMQSVQEAALALQSSQELTEALASLDQANEQTNNSFGQGKIDEAQILASKLIGQLQDNTISNPALLLQHLLGFAPEDYNDLVTALSESGCNYIEIVAAYLHNIQVQAQENNGNNPGVAMAARQGVISKYNYLISELNKFKAMKDPATNLLNVAKHVQGQYDPAIQNLLQQRAAGYPQMQSSYSTLALPSQPRPGGSMGSPYGRSAADPYASLQQQLPPPQMQSPMSSQNHNRMPPTLGGAQLADIVAQLEQGLPIDKQTEQQLQQLLEAQRYQQLLAEQQNSRGQELGDQSKHLTSLGLQTMYGGAQRQSPVRQPTPPMASKAAANPMWSFNSSMF